MRPKQQQCTWHSLVWEMHLKVLKFGRFPSKVVSPEQSIQPRQERRFYSLSFRKRHREVITDAYQQHVEKGKATRTASRLCRGPSFFNILLFLSQRPWSQRRRQGYCRSCDLKGRRFLCKNKQSMERISFIPVHQTQWSLISSCVYLHTFVNAFCGDCSLLGV